MNPVATLTVPVSADLPAEEGLAGCAVAVFGVAERLFTALDEAHFYRPGCWWAIVAAASLTEHGTLEEDIATVAELAGLEPAEVRRWVDERVVHADLGGHLERRVRAAAAQRWKVYDLVDALREAC